MNKFNINENTFLVSDSHFGHFNVKKYEPIRLVYSNKNGFGDDIDKLMIKEWNNSVNNNDIVFHLGDLYFQGKFSEFKIEDLNSLNGNKILLIGNHDRPKYYNKLDSKWLIMDSIIVDGLNEKSLKDLKNEVNGKFRLSQKEKRLQVCFIKTINSKKIMFTHFPLYNNCEYDNKYQNIVDSLQYLYEKYNCELNIHGHTHSNSSSFKDSINLSVELNEFRPKKIKEII